VIHENHLDDVSRQENKRRRIAKVNLIALVFFTQCFGRTYQPHTISLEHFLYGAFAVTALNEVWKRL